MDREGKTVGKRNKKKYDLLRIDKRSSRCFCVFKKCCILTSINNYIKKILWRQKCHDTSKTKMKTIKCIYVPTNILFLLVCYGQLY